MTCPLIYHHSKLFDDEIDSAKAAGFCCSPSLVALSEPPSIVVGRYSVLPWYEYVEEDACRAGSRLIHDYETHRYLATCSEWSRDLDGLTPTTWTNLIDARREWDGPVVLKGETNSRKHQWKTHMYAESLSEAPAVLANLLDDQAIADQGIIIRQYVPLRKLDDGINGLPITDEWRVFCAYGQILTVGFYWASHPEVVPPEPLWVSEFIDTCVLPALPDRIRNGFVVADVALAATGDPLLIELNDGQQSGIGLADPCELYHNLYDWIQYKEGC